MNSIRHHYNVLTELMPICSYFHCVAAWVNATTIADAAAVATATIPVNGKCQAMAISHHVRAWENP